MYQSCEGSIGSYAPIKATKLRESIEAFQTASKTTWSRSIPRLSMATTRGSSGSSSSSRGSSRPGWDLRNGTTGVSVHVTMCTTRVAEIRAKNVRHQGMTTILEKQMKYHQAQFSTQLLTKHLIPFDFVCLPP